MKRFARMAAAGLLALDVLGALGVLGVLGVEVALAQDPLRIEDDEVRVIAPSGTWELGFPRLAWQLTQSRRRKDGAGYHFMFSDTKSDLSMSLSLVPATKCGSPQACRELFWSNPAPEFRGAEKVERFDLKGFAVLKAVVPIRVGESRFEQVSLSAHTVREGSWIDIRVSRLLVTDADVEVLKAFLEAVTIQSR